MKKNISIAVISILLLFTSTEVLLAQTDGWRAQPNTAPPDDGWRAQPYTAPPDDGWRTQPYTTPPDDGWRAQPDTPPPPDDDEWQAQPDTTPPPDDGWRPMTNTAPRYYVILNRAKAGPYTYAELQEMVNRGQITETTQALTEGMIAWTDMQYIAALKPLFSVDYTYQAAQDKKFYIGARFGAIYDVYEAEGDTKKIYDDGLGAAWTISPALSFSYNFVPLLALQIEGIYTIDKAIAQNNTQKVTLDSQSIVMPVLLKFMGRPSIFVLGGFAGGYVAIPLTASTVSEKAGKRTEIGGKVTSVPFGIIAGLEVGLQAGPNDFFIDVRYMRDLTTTKFTANTDNSNDDIELYKASSVLLSIGYRVGF